MLRKIRCILSQFWCRIRLDTLIGIIMATVLDLQQHLVEINNDVDNLSDQIKLLKDQVANGGVVSQSDLDALVAAAQAINDKTPPA